MIEFCTGPYCVPEYDAKGQQIGTRECGDCPLCEEAKEEAAREWGGLRYDQS